MDKNKGLQERGIRAARMYLERQGYEIIEEGWCSEDNSFNFVTLDNDVVVFVDVKTRMMRNDSTPFSDVGFKSRVVFEGAMAEYMAFNFNRFPTNTQIRYDTLSITAISEDRALIRHYIDASATINA